MCFRPVRPLKCSLAAVFFFFFFFLGGGGGGYGGRMTHVAWQSGLLFTGSHVKWTVPRMYGFSVDTGMEH